MHSTFVVTSYAIYASTSQDCKHFDAADLNLSDMRYNSKILLATAVIEIVSILLFVAVIDAAEKVAPGCSRSAANVCEREKNECERRNNSIHEEFCQCYMNFQACLININPKSCMRGSFCILNRHRCVNFNCAFEPKRCKPCYATTEYDMEVPKEDTFLEAIVHHASYTVPLLIILLFGLYAYIGCRYNVKVKGKEWGCDACPHRNFWKLFCCCFFPEKKKKKKRRKKGRGGERSKKKAPKSGKKKSDGKTAAEKPQEARNQNSRTDDEIEIEIPTLDSNQVEESETSSFLH